MKIKILLLAIICVILVIITPTKEVDGIKSDSIKKTIDNANKSWTGLYVPDLVYNYSESEAEAKNTMGQIIEAYSNQFVFKASYFMHMDADILGLYEDSDTDIKYSIVDNDNNINYLRYRLGYKEYPNTTLINWNTDNITHGLMWGSILTEDEILEILDINKDSLREYVSSEEVKENISSNTLEFGEYSLHIPVDLKNIKYKDNGNEVLAYIDSKLVFMVIYNKDIPEINSNLQEDLILNENIVLRYLKENPFNIESDSYTEYENILNNIDNINLKDI